MVKIIGIVALCAAAFAYAEEDALQQLESGLNCRQKPITFTTPEMVARAKGRVEAKAEPWFGNYLRLKKYAQASFSREVVPYASHQIRNKEPDGLHEVSGTDFCAARDCALVWLIEEDEAYRDQGKMILLKWARTFPEPIVYLESDTTYPYCDANLGLAGGVAMIFYCHAYTLLYDEFDAAEHKDICLWLDKVARKLKYWHLAWTANEYYGNQNFNNHLSWHNAGIAYIGFALQDANMVAWAIDDTENPRDFKEMLAGAILMPGDETHDTRSDDITPGEVYDRYRSSQKKGLGYAMYHGLALVYLAEAAHNNGIELYEYTAPGGENLLQLYSYYAEFIEKSDSALKSGQYKGDTVPISYIPVYDLINTRYFGNKEIRAVIKAYGSTVDLNKGQHGGTIGVTHLSEWEMFGRGE